MAASHPITVNVVGGFDFVDFKTLKNSDREALYRIADYTLVRARGCYHVRGTPQIAVTLKKIERLQRARLVRCTVQRGTPTVELTRLGRDTVKELKGRLQ